MTTTLERTLDRVLPRELPHDLRVSAAAGELLRVVVGSRLHGFAGPGSDHDQWVVVAEPRDHHASWASRKVFQGIDVLTDDASGTEVVSDVTVVGVSTFFHYCAMGAPQALEVLFAPSPVVDRLGPMRHAFRVNPDTARASYRRQLRLIVTNHAEVAKQRRHAFRLGLNLLDALEYGRFNPALDAEARAWVLDQAATGGGFADRLEELTGLDLRP